MSDRIKVYRNGPAWSVRLPSGHVHATFPQFDRAITRAHGVASYARRHRFNRDLQRTAEALSRLEANR